MSRIGVSDFHVAELLTDAPGEQTTYGEPERMPGLINVGLTKTVPEASLYTDDKLDEYVAELTGMEISVNAKELDAKQEAKLLGKEVDTHGGVVTGGNDNAPYFAVMFRSKKSDGNYQYRVMYKVRFRPYDETYDTKGENITFQTSTITGAVLGRQFDGNFDYKLDESEENEDVIKAWFDAPVEKDMEVI